MQQLTKTILKFLIHVLPSLQTGEDNQHTPNNRLIEPDSSLIEGYCGDDDFDLEKIVEDSKRDSELPSRIYQSYKKIKNNSEGMDIHSKIINYFFKSNDIRHIWSTEVYKYLLKIVISGIYDEIKTKEDIFCDGFFTNMNSIIFSRCLEEKQIIIKREFFEGEETKKLNFEKFLIVIGFKKNVLEKIFSESELFDTLKADRIYKIISGIKKNLEVSFYYFLKVYGKKRLIETYFSIVKFILESNKSNTDLNMFELEFYNRIIDILSMTNENLLEDLTVKREFEEITQNFLDKTRIFNKKEKETNFSTEMFCIIRYLDIYDVFYKYDGEVYNDKDNFLMKRIRKSEDYIINLSSEKLYMEAEEADEDFDLIRDIFLIYRYHDIPYIKEMNLEKVFKMKTNFCLNFISLHYSSVTDSDKKIFEEGFQLILSEETNPENFRRNLEMGLIKINFENRFEIFNQFTRTFIDIYATPQLLSQIDDVFIKTYKKCLNSTISPKYSAVEIFFLTACSFNVESESSVRFFLLYLKEQERVLGVDCFLECSDDLKHKISEKIENCKRIINEKRSKHSYSGGRRNGGPI